MADKEVEATYTEEPSKYPVFVQELMDRFKAVERKLTENKYQMDAELKRTQERLEASYTKQRDLDGQKLIVHFLEVLDNLDWALSHATESADSFHSGVRLVADLFRKKLQQLGVVLVPLKDKPYDPEFAQAIFAQEVDKPELHGIVLQEHVTCYAIDATIIRPGQVVVGKKREVSNGSG